MKTFYIKTLGCKVNQCDSQEIRERFFELGWRESAQMDAADICLINTCCVTNHADRKSRQAIREAVRQERGPLVSVTGCLAAYDRSSIEDIKGVDVIFAHKEKDGLSQWLGKLSQGTPAKTNPPGHFAGRTRAFVKIQDGCDNRCSYCVVPLARGPSRSVAMPRIIDTVQRFVDAGHKEIVLTGVCLGSFGADLVPRSGLTDLISRLEDIKDLHRIRLSSIEAGDVTAKLIDKMAHSDKLCPHLHIPFQSGDDDVLRSMNKRLAVKDHEAIVAEARKKIKDLSITCDIIVGFPTETEKNFRNTVKFLEFLVPLKTHIFTFSRRKGIPSARMDSVSDIGSIKKRHDILKAVSEGLSNKFKSGYLDKELSVLFEQKRDGAWQGYSQNYIKVSVRSKEDLSNKIRMVRIFGFQDATLAAE